jgi:hypothetical protein
LRLTSIRFAPALAKPAAIASPSPFDPPVITAVRPLKSNSFIPGSMIQINSWPQIVPTQPRLAKRACGRFVQKPPVNGRGIFLQIYRRDGFKIQAE